MNFTYCSSSLYCSRNWQKENWYFTWNTAQRSATNEHTKMCIRAYCRFKRQSWKEVVLPMALHGSCSRSTHSLHRSSLIHRSTGSGIRTNHVASSRTRGWWGSIHQQPPILDVNGKANSYRLKAKVISATWDLGRVQEKGSRSYRLQQSTS